MTLKTVRDMASLILFNSSSPVSVVSNIAGVSLRQVLQSLTSSIVEEELMQLAGVSFLLLHLVVG